MPFQIETQLTCAETSGPYLALTLGVPTIARIAHPGQFVRLQLDDDWPKPFSVHSVIKDNIGLLIKPVGLMTGQLQRRIETGQDTFVQVSGPFGSGFDIPMGINDLWLVAGGVGFAPLYFLGQHQLQPSQRPIRLKILVGGQTNRDVVYHWRPENLTDDVLYATEDGSRGYQGLVTDLLEIELRKGRPSLICACGPKQMLKKIAEMAASRDIPGSRGIPCQVAVEEIMACGHGSCWGCGVPTVSGYKQACVDGPVFGTEEVMWDEFCPKG